MSGQECVFDAASLLLIVPPSAPSRVFGSGTFGDFECLHELGNQHHPSLPRESLMHKRQDFGKADGHLLCALLWYIKPQKLHRAGRERRLVLRRCSTSVSKDRQRRCRQGYYSRSLY